MEQIFYYANFALAALYFLLTAYYLKGVVSHHSLWGGGIRFFLPALLGLHFAKLVSEGLYFGHCPLLGVGEAASFTAFALAVIYFIVERYQKYFATGVVFLAIVTLFQAIFAFSPAGTPETNVAGVPFALHAGVALFGLAAISTASVYSIIYLFMNRLLKGKGFPSWIRKVPPIETIDRMQRLSAIIAFVLITIAIAGGFAMGLFYSLPVSPTDGKVIFSAILLVVFACATFGSVTGKFSGRQRSMVTLIGFLIAVISMTVVGLLLPTFHRF